MPYYVEKSGKTWRLAYRAGKAARNVSKDSPEVTNLGFRKDMTFEQAKALSKKLQAEEQLQRHAAVHARRTSFIIEGLRLETAFFQEIDILEFEATKLEGVKPGHWRAAKRLIAKAGDPARWKDAPNVFVSQFLAKGWGEVYVGDLIRLINRWGLFHGRKYNRFYEPIKLLPSHWTRIKAAKRGMRRALPLSSESLQSRKHLLTPTEYGWMWVSIWFGLRPREIDNLLKNDLKLWYLHEDVLYVFQEKLAERGVKEEDCWKSIPVWLPEQRMALQYIEKKVLLRPTIDKIKEVFGRGYGTYSGRNNFVAMLEDKGQELRTLQQWMGHLNISQTERYARKRKTVFMPKIK